MSQLSNVSVMKYSGFTEIIKSYQNDSSPIKIDLIYGTYKSEDGSQYLLPVVKHAERVVLEETLDHSYLPPHGIDDFSKQATTLLLGNIEKQWKEGMIFGIQTIGGAGALKVGAEFLSRHVKSTTFYYSNPTWEMHQPIFTLSGFQNCFSYRYLNEKTKALDAEGFFEDMLNAERDSVIILHACCHNPTGIDLNKEQWKAVAEIVKERKLIPFFDIAYQGLASGDPQEDAWAVRYFLSEGIEFLCAQSFSKTFTMYNERAGNLVFALKFANNVESVKCHVSRIVRAIYSNPPNHGAMTVRKILADPDLHSEWLKTFKVMDNRLKELRTTFRKALEELGAPGTWNYITDQTGLFIFLNLTENQVQYMRRCHHIYLATQGRINVTGMNKNNIYYIAEALNDTLKNNI